MRKLASAIVFLLLVGCSSGITTHDNIRAAELVVDFLSSLESEQGIRNAYDWSDDKYQEQVSFAEFQQLISSVRSKNAKADISLVGYETFGPREMMAVYAQSETKAGILHFKFALTGTKTRDYYLLEFSTSDSEFSKDGNYRDYQESIVVSGV